MVIGVNLKAVSPEGADLPAEMANVTLRCMITSVLVGRNAACVIAGGGITGELQ